MISTTGALIKPHDKDEMTIIKKQLTVRPINSMDLGFPLPSFKVFRQKNDTLLVPQHYARKSLCANLKEKETRTPQIGTSSQIQWNITYENKPTGSIQKYHGFVENITWCYSFVAMWIWKNNGCTCFGV